MWCVAELDEEYIAKMEDVLALYEKPYRSAEPVICLDEKPVSLHHDVRPSRPARPGHIAKRDNEYKRCGTANVFAVVEPKAGRHFNCATPYRSAAQFAQVVRRLVADYPFARKIHLVMDNLNIHCRKSLTDHLGDKEGRYVWNRLKVHYTPKHGSWLKPKSNSACYPDNVWGPAAFPNWIYWRPASRLGTPRPTVTGPAFNGSSPAKPLAPSSATKGILLSGQRPRGLSQRVR